MRYLPTAPGERISGCDCCPITVRPCGDGVIEVMKAAGCGGTSNDMLPPGGASVTTETTVRNERNRTDWQVKLARQSYLYIR